MTDERLVVGLMSGTSCDGIEAVVAALGNRIALRAHVHVGYDDALRQRLLALADATPAELARLHVELGAAFAAAAQTAIDVAGVSAADVDVIACSGHTAVHLPPARGDPGATLVLGDGDVVAELTGCPVLSDFRARDRAAGGHGAPLVPFADARLLRHPTRVRAALNLGGIANITVVPTRGEVVAFDTGPGNMLLDGALARATAGRCTYDAGGALGLAGRVDEAWLAAALAEDAFLALPPPRSTGRERYGAAFLDRHGEWLRRQSLPDLAATLAAYTVEAVARALEQYVASVPDELVVSGGGARNACLMRGLLRRIAPIVVTDSQTALGIPGEAREALAFALLAEATLAGMPANLPSVTGARHAVCLGKLSLGAGGRPPRRG